MKNILIINGHPYEESFNYALSEAYLQGIDKNQAQVEMLNIGQLDFDPNLKYGFSKVMELEPDLVEATEKIKWADHIVWVFPMWWYGMPAIMKGFIDRVFLPGVAFKYQQGKAFPEKLFTGKTARLIITADTPQWYDRWFMKSPAIQQLKKGTLEFCGIKPVKITYIGPIKDSTNDFRANWLRKVQELGEKLA